MRDQIGRATRYALPALFAALISAGSLMSLPFPGSPVPIVLQNLLVILAGLVLGPLRGGAAVLIFLLLGALGFPVFAGGHGGLAWFAGPTGGYLVGYLLGAILAGLLSASRRTLATFLASFAGFALILVLGTLRLKLAKDLEWATALSAGLIPFLFGDLIKALLAGLLSLKLGPFLDRLGRETPARREKDA